MNWPNAKNLTLIFMIVLNIFLGVLVYANRDDYRLNATAVQAAERLLSDNLITLNTAVPREYAPMNQLLMTPGSNDMYLEIFFPDNDDLRITPEYNKTIYRTDTEALVLQNGGAVYTRQAPAGTAQQPSTGAVIGEDLAARLCDAFISNSVLRDEGFLPDRYSATGTGYSVEYRQSYKSKHIFSNYIIFDVTADGIARVRCRYDQADGWEAGKKEIISADRALFILMKYIINEYEGTEITIDRMDIVYVQPETSANANASLKAVPHYRFYYSENDRPVFINAYTGVVVEYAY